MGNGDLAGAFTARKQRGRNEFSRCALSVFVLFVQVFDPSLLHGLDHFNNRGR